MDSSHFNQSEECQSVKRVEEEEEEVKESPRKLPNGATPPEFHMRRELLFFRHFNSPSNPVIQS